MGKVIDLTGQKFNRLTAIEFIGLNKYKKAIWKCACDCGNEVNVLSAHLKNGNTNSCGCYQVDRIVEVSTKHGGKGTRLYRIWKNMKQRCYNPKLPIFKWYGGKGVVICDEWINDFSNFSEWAQNNGYQENLTIDRIDFNGNYHPDNCRWITIQEQQWNKCTNKVQSV